MSDQSRPAPAPLPSPPKAAVDAGSRTILLTQAHPLLVGQEQKVLVSFAFLKMLASKVLDMEARAEAATGDPTAVPGPNQSQNGKKT